MNGFLHALDAQIIIPAQANNLRDITQSSGLICIPAAQLDVREVTRPSFSRRLKGVACETRKLQRRRL